VSRRWRSASVSGSLALWLSSSRSELTHAPRPQIKVHRAPLLGPAHRPQRRRGRARRGARREDVLRIRAPLAGGFGCLIIRGGVHEDGGWGVTERATSPDSLLLQPLSRGSANWSANPFVISSPPPPPITTTNLNPPPRAPPRRTTATSRRSATRWPSPRRAPRPTGRPTSTPSTCRAPRCAEGPRSLILPAFCP
jgi:hypothetical protein